MYKINAVNKNEELEFIISFENLQDLQTYLFLIFKNEFKREFSFNISFEKIKEITKHYYQLFDNIDVKSLDYFFYCQNPVVLKNYSESLIYTILKK